MSQPGRLVVYVTSHGFGHLNRSVAVINRIPLDVPVTIRCNPNLFDHWRERLKRPADLDSHESDAGAVNPPGNSALTDGPATIQRAREVHDKAVNEIGDESETLRRLGAAAILCDAPPLPLVAARRARIPGYLLANFPWADSYEPHARQLGVSEVRFVAEIRDAYRHATALFRTEPALRMTRAAREVIDVGMVVTPGRDRREELREHFGIPTDEKVVYFYIGRYGQANLGWERLAAMSGVHFVGFHPEPTGQLTNFHVVAPDHWTGADLAASADAIVAKAGYGTTCEAIVSGTPMIYPPRTGFAEHRALDRALQAWGGGIRASASDFAALKLERQIQRAFQTEPGPSPFATDGADRVAEELTRVCRAAR